jgi:hypothetical protein
LVLGSNLLPQARADDDDDDDHHKPRPIPGGLSRRTRLFVKNWTGPVVVRSSAFRRSWAQHRLKAELRTNPGQFLSFGEDAFSRVCTWVIRPIK